jgi:hypothetical protein
MSGYVIPPSSSHDANSGPPLSTVKPRSKAVLRGEQTQVFENCLDDFSEISIKDLRLESPMDGVYYIDHVMSAEECSKLREQIDKSDSLSFWCAGQDDNSDVRSFRNAQTIEIFTHSFAEKIWRRIHHLLDDKMSLVIPDDAEHPEYERELVGRWLPTGLNPDNLFARYPHYGSFAPHTDGRAIIDFNHRSHYTALVYFNTVPKDMGAGTRFYDKSAVTRLEKRTINNTEYWTADESLITSAITAEEGRLLIFHQALVHEGIPPVAPFLKYILRSDVIFERTPKVCDSDKDKDAYRIFKQAEDLAENGDVQAAIPLFRKAFKLSPEMAQIMGQA